MPQGVIPHFKGLLRIRIMVQTRGVHVYPTRHSDQKNFEFNTQLYI